MDYRQEESCESDGNVLYLSCGGGFSGVRNCQNS